MQASEDDEGVREGSVGGRLCRGLRNLSFCYFDFSTSPSALHKKKAEVGSAGPDLRWKFLDGDSFGRDPGFDKTYRPIGRGMEIGLSSLSISHPTAGCLGRYFVLNWRTTLLRGHIRRYFLFSLSYKK